MVCLVSSIFFFFTRPPRAAIAGSFWQAARQAKPVTCLPTKAHHLDCPTRLRPPPTETFIWFHRLGAETQKTFNLMEEKMKKKNEKATNKPVHRIRVGAVSCSVFLNKTKEGTQFP